MVTERLVLVAATLVLAAVGLLPVAAMLKETLIADGRFSLEAYRALLASGDHLALLMSHSLQLAFLTSSLATLIGVPLGILLGKTDLPWRSALTLVFAAPLLIPSYSPLRSASGLGRRWLCAERHLTSRRRERARRPR